MAERKNRKASYLLPCGYKLLLAYLLFILIYFNSRCLSMKLCRDLKSHRVPEPEDTGYRYDMKNPPAGFK